MIICPTLQKENNKEKYRNVNDVSLLPRSTHLTTGLYEMEFPYDVSRMAFPVPELMTSLLVGGKIMNKTV